VAAWFDGAASLGVRVFALAFAFALASTVCGWFLGLLFGVPRSLSRPQAADGSKSAPAGQESGDGKPSTRVNTNLEDISDWLTKTLVGVGLTQLYQVPHTLWHYAGLIDANGFDWPHHGQLLALSLFLYFAPGGFWLGYVGTRTILNQLFSRYDGANPAAVRTAGSPDNLNIDPSRNQIVPATDGLAAADQQVMSKSLQSLTTPAEMAAWGAAKARAGSMQEARVALEDAYRKDAGNTDIKLQLAKVYTAMDQFEQADALWRDLPGDDLAVYNALYLKPPAGFTKAITIGEELLKNPEKNRDAMLHVWMACAYGQQHRYLKSQGVATLQLDLVRDKVIVEVKAALSLDRETKALLWSLLHPSESPDSNLVDNDLDSLAGTEELEGLLRPQSA
jgi:hypothetical protein